MHERSVCDGRLPWDEVDDKYAIMCVQHDYAPTVNVKLAGRKQEAYPRKNWSSMVLYNCGHPAGRAQSTRVIFTPPTRTRASPRLFHAVRHEVY